jgi:hypothetical protein
MASLTTNTWTTVSGNITVPAGKNFMMPQFHVLSSVPAGDTIEWDNYVVRKAASAELLVDGTITATKIVASTITSNEIAANTIVAGDIAANTITAAQIATGTITANEIAATTITGAKIAAGTITATQIASGTITTTQLAAGAVTAGKVSAGAIDGMTITAPFIQTAATGNRISIFDDGSEGVIKFSAGLAGETSGAINPQLGTFDTDTNIPYIDFKTSAKASGIGSSAAQMRLVANTGMNGTTLRMLNNTKIIANEIDCDGINAGATINVNGGGVSTTGNIDAGGHLSTADAPTTTSAVNVRIGSGGVLNIVTSLTQHKIQPKVLPVDALLPVLDIPFVDWFDAAEHQANKRKTKGLRRIPGVLAEDVARIAPQFADYRDGKLVGVQYDRLGLAALPLLKHFSDRLAALEEKMA